MLQNKLFLVERQADHRDVASQPENIMH